MFSPAHDSPIRIELSGFDIESLRFFDPETQSSLQTYDKVTITQARELLLTQDLQTELLQAWLKHNPRSSSLAGAQIERCLREGTFDPKIDFLSGLL